jgi:DNA-binding transcriptional ArsR family regulator
VKDDSKQADGFNGKWVTWINWTAAGLVFIVAIFAFVLSYSSLQHLANNNGVDDTLSYTWPLLLDFAMVVFSLAILRAYLRQEKPVYPWILTITFAALATFANVLDATTLDIDPKIIKAGVKALAPITLVLAFELLMGMLRAEVKRKEETSTIKELTEQMGDLRVEIETLESNRGRLQRQVETLETAKVGIKALPAPANTQDKKAQRVKALLAYYAKEPQSPMTKAADEIGVSRQTVANYLDELEEDGAIHRNGQGIQVLRPVEER